MNAFWSIMKNAFCVIGVLFVGYYFCVGLCGGGSGSGLPDPHKVSQVSVPPQKPAWEKSQPQYWQTGPVECCGPPSQRQQATPFRLPSWDEGFVPYAVWRSRQNPCVPNRPH